MNAARREIIAEFRNQGMTGKEAYEASKDAEFMARWLRVSVRDSRIDGKVKRAPKHESWRSRLRFLKKLAMLEFEKKKAKHSKVVKRSDRIRRLMAKGLALKQAIERVDKPK